MYMYVRRGEAIASGCQAAGGATEFNQSDYFVKSVVQFRLTKYPKELGHFQKSSYCIAGHDSSIPEGMGVVS